MKDKNALDKNTDGNKIKGIGRRGFIKSAAVATLSAGFVGASGAKKVLAYPAEAKKGWHKSGKLQSHPIIRAPRGTERFWAKVRKTFNLPRNYIHMNTGTTGSQPLFSQNNLSVYNQY
jgi:hypothetical protein